MYKSKTIAVVVPAYNEEKLIGRVIETMPDYVDKIIIVDDASTDTTVESVKRFKNPLDERLILIQHESNQGVGGAIVTGYKWARDHNMDIAVVMAGDAQMNPEDLPTVLDPVINGEADYVKGNRLFTGNAWQMIPKYRYLGNSFLSLLTKIASGYWHVADSQSGYTAISLRAICMMDLDSIYKRYGYPNDMLVRLNVHNFKVKDVPVTPIYNIGEKSGIKLWKVIPSLSLLLFKKFLWRLKEKYVIRDFHPLIFFYVMAFLLLPLGIGIGIWLFYLKLSADVIYVNWLVMVSLLLISGLQSLFFAMWFDMDYNKNVKN